MIKEARVSHDLAACNRGDKSGVGVPDGWAAMVSEVAASTPGWVCEELRPRGALTLRLHQDRCCARERVRLTSPFHLSRFFNGLTF